jgi:6-pyruvoyl-tetrahydropterin synthase
MLCDFKNIKGQVEHKVLKILDHNSLYDIIENPTAEKTIEWISIKLKGAFSSFGLILSRLRLYETEDSYVEWRKD